MNIIEASRLGEHGAEVLDLLKDICLTVNGQQDGMFVDGDIEEAKAEYVTTCVEMIIDNLKHLKQA